MLDGKRRVSLVGVVVPQLDALNVAHELVALRRAPASPSSTALVCFVGSFREPLGLSGGRAHYQAHGLGFVVTAPESVRGVPARWPATRRLHDGDAHSTPPAAMLGDGRRVLPATGGGVRADA